MASEPSLRQQLLTARIRVQRQIDRLRARAYPAAPTSWTPGDEFPHALDQLGSELGRTLRDIDEALEALGPED
jgi:biotin operon repressor